MTTALDELRAFPQWVAFRLAPSPKRAGKNDKIPVNPHNGKNASVTNPETWGTYDQAIDRACQDELGGVGFVFTSSDPYVGIDLDGCIEGGELEAWALAIIERLASYTETSPSGKGVHIIARGELPDGGNRKGQIELYATGRFLTWTGKVYGARSAIAERSEAIRALHGELFPSRLAAPAPAMIGGGQTDRDLVSRAMTARDGASFSQLWHGDVTGYVSPSEADLALANKLAFWVGPDPERIDQLFRQSGLYRPKWDERHGGASYGRITIDKALAGRVDFYGGRMTAAAAPPAVNGNGNHGSSHLDIVLSRELDPEDESPFAESLVPDLSKEARLPDNLGADVGGWLADYVRYASDVSERTPELMHQAAGLWLASVAVARRLHIAMPHGNVYPNLYLLAVAKTTLFSKTTGMGVMEALLEDAMPHLTLSNDSTPEAMLAEFGGKQPNNLESNEVSDDIRELWRQGQKFAAQRGLILEEASGLLAGLRKDYMQGMAELLLRLHDCPNQYRRHTKGGGYLVIRNAYLSICGWTTPVRLRTVETDMAWHDGLFARFALLTPESQGIRPSAEPRQRPDRPSELVTTLSRLANNMLPMPESHQRPVASWAVPMTPEAAAAQRRYYIALSYDLLTAKTAPDGRLFGTYGRLPAMATKVALLLAALDWAAQEGKPILRVTLEHYAQGQRIAERWRASAHRLLDELSAKPEAQEENSALDRTMKVLQRNGDGWLTIRDLVRKMDSNRYRTSEVLQFVRTLEQDGRVEVQERKAEGKGRPSLVCRLLS